MSEAVGSGLALVFPGQGSQFVGMGRDLYDSSDVGRQVFEEADRVLGFSLSRLCFEGPEEELVDTLNAQPAIVATSAAFWMALKERLGGSLMPAFVAGHSLGEYSALLAAGALDLPTVLRLVRERGRVMKEAGAREPGAMAAVLGMGADALRSICREVGEVWLANDNSPNQIVLSGKKSALEQALKLASERGARRTIPLAVTIASHSPLMQPAADAFAATVSDLTLHDARLPIVANVSAAPVTKVEDLRDEMLRQLTSSVRWVESVRNMITAGVGTFVEIGPKNTLTRLINQIDQNVRALTVGNVAELEALRMDG